MLARSVRVTDTFTSAMDVGKPLIFTRLGEKSPSGKNQIRHYWNEINSYCSWVSGIGTNGVKYVGRNV